jgi:hypothetical protein
VSADEERELDALLIRLREADERVGQAPDAVVRDAKAVFALRGLDQELAELVSDSATMAGSVRGPGESVRLLSFETAEIGVELQVEQSGAGVTVRGVVTGASGQVVVETPGGRYAADLDEEGWFVLEGVAAGPTRVRLTAADGTPVVTSWVLV